MSKEKCETCRGKGKVRGTARRSGSLGPRRVSTSDTCPDCGGTGYKRGTPNATPTPPDDATATDRLAWTDLIAACFGFGTAPFASNRPDLDCAKQAIRAAKAEGASRAEFAKMIAMYPRRYIKSEHLLRERLREDGNRLEQLWKSGGS